MSAEFRLFENEFQKSMERIDFLINSMRNAQETNKSCSSVVEEVNTMLEDCKEMIKGIELDITSLDVTTKKSYREVILVRKSDLRSAKIRLDNEQSKVSGKSVLLGEKSLASRDKFHTVQDKIADQDDMIKNAMKSVAEMEDIGSSITLELNQNREKIETVRGKVVEVNSIANAAEKQTKQMQKRENCRIF